MPGDGPMTPETVHSSTQSAGGDSLLGRSGATPVPPREPSPFASGRAQSEGNSTYDSADQPIDDRADNVEDHQTEDHPVRPPSHGFLRGLAHLGKVDRFGAWREKVRLGKAAEKVGNPGAQKELHHTENVPEKFRKKAQAERQKQVDRAKAMGIQIIMPPNPDGGPQTLENLQPDARRLVEDIMIGFSRTLSANVLQERNDSLLGRDVTERGRVIREANPRIYVSQHRGEVMIAMATGKNLNFDPATGEVSFDFGEENTVAGNLTPIIYRPAQGEGNNRQEASLIFGISGDDVINPSQIRYDDDIVRNVKGRFGQETVVLVGDRLRRRGMVVVAFHGTDYTLRSDSVVEDYIEDRQRDIDDVLDTDKGEVQLFTDSPDIADGFDPIQTESRFKILGVTSADQIQYRDFRENIDDEGVEQIIGEVREPNISRIRLSGPAYEQYEQLTDHEKEIYRADRGETNEDADEYTLVEIVRKPARTEGNRIDTEYDDLHQRVLRQEFIARQIGRGGMPLPEDMRDPAVLAFMLNPGFEGGLAGADRKLGELIDKVADRIRTQTADRNIQPENRKSEYAIAQEVFGAAFGDIINGAQGERKAALESTYARLIAELYQPGEARAVELAQASIDTTKPVEENIARLERVAEGLANPALKTRLLFARVVELARTQQPVEGQNPSQLLEQMRSMLNIAEFSNEQKSIVEQVLAEREKAILPDPADLKQLPGESGAAFQDRFNRAAAEHGYSDSSRDKLWRVTEAELRSQDLPLRIASELQQSLEDEAFERLAAQLTAEARLAGNDAALAIIATQRSNRDLVSRANRQVEEATKAREAAEAEAKRLGDQVRAAQEQANTIINATLSNLVGSRVISNNGSGNNGNQS